VERGPHLFPRRGRLDLPNRCRSNVVSVPSSASLHESKPGTTQSQQGYAPGRGGCRLRSGSSANGPVGSDLRLWGTWDFRHPRNVGPKPETESVNPGERWIGMVAWQERPIVRIRWLISIGGIRMISRGRGEGGLTRRGRRARKQQEARELTGIRTRIPRILDEDRRRRRRCWCWEKRQAVVSCRQCSMTLGQGQRNASSDDGWTKIGGDRTRQH
jgi:hypothetical protein